MKLLSWIRGAAAAAVLLTAAGFAQAQDAPFSVSPESGAIGQEITIVAEGDTDFGARRGRVLLSASDVMLKRRRAPSARVISWTNEQIVFAIHKATEGPNDISVRPRGRGKAALTVEGGVEVIGPTLTGRDGDRFFKGDTITLSGENFGTVRGKVGLTPAVEAKRRRGTRRPRVISWTNETIEVKLPSLGPDGFFDITVTNFAGSTQSMSPIELVTPPRPIGGKDRVVGRVGGRYSAVKGTRGDQVTYTTGPDTAITIMGIDATIGRRASIRTVTLIWDPGTSPDQIVLPATYTGEDIAAMTYSTATTFRGSESSTSYVLDSGGQITVNNVVGNRISGTFSGTLMKSDDGPGPATINAAGSFTATMTVPQS